MSLIVRTMWGPEGEVFLLSCDGACLGWLEKNFDALAHGDDPEIVFLIGDGRPIDAVGGLQMSVRRSEDAAAMRFVRQGGDLVWYISSDTAEKFRDLTQALRESTVAGHQYLESPDPSVPAVILSKDEYDEMSLRAMSLD